MVIRVKFSKYGVLKFLGHLDVLRYFQKAIRRSGIDVTYSNGFNPHQIMSFASPLGVGLTSDGEYVDIELNSMTDIDSVYNALASAMTEGFCVNKVTLLREWKPNERKETAMSQVAAADYFVSLKNGYEITKDGCAISPDEFKKMFNEFINRTSIEVTKKTKKSEKTMDIKPFIYAFSFNSDEFAAVINCDNETVSAGLTHSDAHNTGINIYMQLSAGSVTNIKPELVLDAFFEEYGLVCNEFGIHYHRMEMYRDISCEGMNQLEVAKRLEEGTLPERKLVPLYDFCQTTI